MEQEKSNGQLFKEKKGYSKSLKRVMKKHGLDASSPEDVKKHKEANKDRKKKVKAVQKKKREANREYRRQHPRTKKGKKKQSNVTKPA